MEGARNEPATHRAIRRIHSEDYSLALPEDVLQGIRRLKEDGSDRVLGVVRQTLEQEVTMIKEDFPRMSSTSIDALAALVYGPLLYGRDLLLETADSSLRVKNASAQDAVIEGVLWGSSLEADSSYAKYIATMLAISEEVSGNRTTSMYRWLNGIKGAVAIARALESDGWGVRFPNYSNKPQEVYEWDISNFVDFVATRDDSVLFVDAKARLLDSGLGQINRISSVEPVNMRRMPYIRYGLPDSLTQFKPSLDNGKLNHVVVTVPTNPDQLSGLVTNPDPKKSLAGFGISSEQSQLVAKINRYVR